MSMKGTNALLVWCKRITQNYGNDVTVENFTSSWKNGMALCAIIHYHRPDLIPFQNLSKENIQENNDLAFRVAEQELGIPSLLSVEDMVQMKAPDRLCIITYVSQYYHYFKDKPPGGGRCGGLIQNDFNRSQLPKVAADDKIISPPRVRSKSPLMEPKRKTVINAESMKQNLFAKPKPQRSPCRTAIPARNEMSNLPVNPEANKSNTSMNQSFPRCNAAASKNSSVFDLQRKLFENNDQSEPRKSLLNTHCKFFEEMEKQKSDNSKWRKGNTHNGEVPCILRKVSTDSSNHAIKSFLNTTQAKTKTLQVQQPHQQQPPKQLSIDLNNRSGHCSDSVRKGMVNQIATTVFHKDIQG